MRKQPIHSPGAAPSIAIVGCGYMGSRHAWAYAARKPAPRLVLVDRERAAAEGLAHALGAAGVDARVVSPADLETVDDLDAVDVCTPPPEHTPSVLAALHRDMPTLCEKPLSASPEAEQAMIQAAGRSSGWLGVGYPYRHHPATRWVQGVLDEGRVGRPLVAHLRLGVVGGRNMWQHRLDPRSGGGVANEVGSHLVDMAIRWFGGVGRTRLLAASTMCRMRAIGGRVVPIEGPDSALVELRHTCGTRSVLALDMAAAVHFQSVEIQGTAGMLWSSVRPGFPAVVRQAGDVQPEERLFHTPVDMLAAVIDAFLAGLAAGGPPASLLPQPGIAASLVTVNRAMRRLSRHGGAG